jgi:signal transduction histidine kinase
VLLHQVLMNLVCSSLKYTHSGAIRIRASSSEAGVHVVVADTGAGIPALQLQQALDPFELVRRGGGVFV